MPFLYLPTVLLFTPLSSFLPTSGYLMGIVFLKHAFENSAIEDDFETIKFLNESLEINQLDTIKLII